MRPAAAQHAVEDVEVAAAGQRRAGVERLVEAAQAQQQLAVEAHVAARADDARADREQPVALLATGPWRMRAKPRPKPPKCSKTICARVSSR